MSGEIVLSITTFLRKQVGPMGGGIEWTDEARNAMFKLVTDKNSQIKIHVVTGCPLAFVDLLVSEAPLSTVVYPGNLLPPAYVGR